MSYSGNEFGENVELNFNSVAVLVRTMVAYDVTKSEHVDDEEQRTKH